MFHENGQLRYKGNYRHGKLNGLLEYFDAKGNLTKTEEYKDGEVYKVDGKLDPLWGKFDEEGNLKSKEDWKDEVLED
jgi:antitoxin component YwqK of YwqJK toxin-antitoxin module